jgi:hypothetical protein
LETFEYLYDFHEVNEESIFNYNLSNSIPLLQSFLEVFGLFYKMCTSMHIPKQHNSENLHDQGLTKYFNLCICWYNYCNHILKEFMIFYNRVLSGTS